MTTHGLLYIALYLAFLIALAKPIGLFIACVFEGRPTILDPALKPIERWVYRVAGISPQQEMDWKEILKNMLLFNVIGILFLFALERLQGFLPLNPGRVGAVPPDLAFNTAVSFVTNTNWQANGGETTMSYLTQMLGLTVQNFLSAATGLALLAAVIRGFARYGTSALGNFWVDLVRSTLYILLPFSVVLALVLVSQGSVQTLAPGKEVNCIQDPGSTQVIALGPVASEVAIKHLGTNGGGFFNANSAHPFENPTPFSDFLLVLSQGLLAAALCYTYGRMVHDTHQGWSLLAAMLILLLPFALLTYQAEASGNPVLNRLGVDQVATATNPGGNMEGKEVRFGIPHSSLFATVTTATSCGAVDAMHDSFTPLGGLVPLVMMHLGEVVLGGVGSGLYGMLIFVIVAVFVAGLLVGRTPEYLGHKIEPYEMKMASLAILLMPIIVLVLTAVAVLVEPGRSAVGNPGPHGFSEILYAFSSMANNNGSAFAGLNANSVFYNVIGGVAMFLGRYWPMIPTLALAGSLGRKRETPAGAGTLPTHTPLFVGWLIAVILIVGALNFLPALALGPIVEHLLMIGGG